MRIKNNHKTQLSLPDGTSIAPGATEIVSNPDLVKRNAVVQAWIKAGVMEIVEERPEYVETTTIESTEQEFVPANDAVKLEKAELIAKLEAAGIKFDKRWGIEKLQSALDEG